jgi:hypothetical protein
VKNVPIVVIVLYKDGKAAASDIWSILHRQKGAEWELAVITEGADFPLPAGMKKKAGAHGHFEQGEKPGKALNRLLAEKRSGLFVFLTNRVQPTHDHWLKRIITPILDGKAVAIAGRTISTPEANYFLANELRKRFPASLPPSAVAERFVADNCAILLENAPPAFFDESANDPCHVWAVGSGAKPFYAREALVMRPTLLTLGEIYDEYRRQGEDAALLGRPVSLPALFSGIIRGMAGDILYAVRGAKFQYLWYPPFYRSAVHFGLYAGRKSKG